MKIPEYINFKAKHAPRQQVRYKGRAIGNSGKLLDEAGFKGRYFIFFMSSPAIRRWDSSHYFYGGCPDQHYFKVIT